MPKIKFDKVCLDKKDKKKIAICMVLIFLCALISIGFMLFTIIKIDDFNTDTFFVAFICTYIGILIITCPSALIFSKIMKRARYNQYIKEYIKENTEAQDA